MRPSTADTKLTSNTQPSSFNPTNTAPSVDGIANSFFEFHYDPESNVTFDMWFRRYEDLFKLDFANQDDAWKVRLLLRKLGLSELDSCRDAALALPVVVLTSTSDPPCSPTILLNRT
ncbi:unnamed protein product [Schistosoma curassoni]|uniref:DUF7083 domain-containing protein n=1 Tax=Schistosoma curassoni TaxID=6186 RepID=A0A183L0F3_9TREM|nr:unnamed protein product [Schistosoma curassoni]